MRQNHKRFDTLAITRTELGPWALLALALIVVTFFGLLERQPENSSLDSSLVRTSFQIKRDLYDIGIEDKDSVKTSSLETGL